MLYCQTAGFKQMVVVFPNFPWSVCPFRNVVALSQVADGETASNMKGGQEYIE
jgi:hypothetical protein